MWEEGEEDAISAVRRRTGGQGRASGCLGKGIQAKGIARSLVGEAQCGRGGRRGKGRMSRAFQSWEGLGTEAWREQ